MNDKPCYANIDCMSTAWNDGHTDGLKDVYAQNYIDPNTQAWFDYADGWTTGYAERDIYHDDKE